MISAQEEYKLYYAQSLYKAGLYQDASRAALRILDAEELKNKILTLRAAIAYEQDDLGPAKALLDQCLIQCRNLSTATSFLWSESRVVPWNRIILVEAKKIFDSRFFNILFLDFRIFGFSGFRISFFQSISFQFN